MSDAETDRVVRMTGAEIDHEQLSFEPFWKRPVEIEATPMPAPFEVETPEGTMEGNQGDILIRGVDGELYPCDAGIFYRTYIADKSDVPRYSESDLRAAQKEFNNRTLDHVPTGVTDTDARAGVRAFVKILKQQRGADDE